MHLYEQIFVLLKVFNQIKLLLFILTLKDVRSLLNHRSYHCVENGIIDTVCAKNIRQKGSNYALHLHLVYLFKFDNITKELDEEIKSILIYLGHFLDKLLDLLHQPVGAFRVSNLSKFVIEFGWNKGSLHLNKYFLPVIGYNMCIFDSPQKWKVFKAHMQL